MKGNISKFYDTPSTVLTGMGAGFGWQWRLDETYRLSSGIHLVERAIQKQKRHSNILVLEAHSGVFTPF